MGDYTHMIFCKPSGSNAINFITATVTNDEDETLNQTMASSSSLLLQKDNNTNYPNPTNSISPESNDELIVDNLWVDLQAGELTYACLWGPESECKMKYQQIEELEAHMEMHLSDYATKFANNSQAETDNPVCQVRGCQILVTSIEELSRHLKMHIFHAKKQYIGLHTVRERYPELISCNFAATSRLVYQGDPLICEWNHCFASFIDINEYIVHIEEQHIRTLNFDTNRDQDGQYMCLWSDCKVTFKNKAALRWHIQHHSGDKMCACPFCGAFFAHTSRLMEHVIRRQKGNLICHFCRKTFMDEVMLRRHCKRHIKEHQCPYCPLLLETPNDLRRHIQGVHAKVKNHICEYCGHGFYQKSDYNRHVELHFSNELHECEECGQRFRWAKQLREHIKKHDQDYIQSPYQCHLCESQYRRGSALSKHFIQKHELKVPDGFSRYQYKKCSDGFFRLQTLRYIQEMENIPAETEGKEQLEREQMELEENNQH